MIDKFKKMCYNSAVDRNLKFNELSQGTYTYLLTSSVIPYYSDGDYDKAVIFQLMRDTLEQYKISLNSLIEVNKKNK